MSTLKEGQVFIPNGILNFPKLYKAEGIKNDPSSKPRYGCQIYLPKSDTATRKKIEAEIERLTKEKFKGVKLKAKDLFISDGDGEDGTDVTKGHWIISANRAESQGRPAVIDRNRKAIDSSESQKVYAGSVCNFLIGVYVPGKWSKICASLEVVQFVADGTPLGAGGVNVDDVMPDLGAEDSDGLDDI